MGPMEAAMSTYSKTSLMFGLMLSQFIALFVHALQPKLWASNTKGSDL